MRKEVHNVVGSRNLRVLVGILALDWGRSVSLGEPGDPWSVPLPVDGSSVALAIITLAVSVFFLVSAVLVGVGCLRRLLARLKRRV